MWKLAVVSLDMTKLSLQLSIRKAGLRMFEKEKEKTIENFTPSRSLQILQTVMELEIVTISDS